MQQNILLHSGMIMPNVLDLTWIFVAQKLNQFWKFQSIFFNNFKNFLKVLPLKNSLKYSQLILSSDNKKILLTTRNVRQDSGRNATKY